MSAYFTIVNPEAGGGRGKTRANEALAALRGSGLALSVHETRGPGDATTMVREAYEAGTRRFLVVGGDGTTFEAVNGAFAAGADAKDRATFALLPVGTGNSFLRDFGVTRTADAMSTETRTGRFSPN